MALVYVVMVQRNARNHGVTLLPDWRGIRALCHVGSWLMLRTLSLRIAILATVVVVTAQGPVNLAAHQLAMTIFTFLAFALDALAIAAQALIGKELGASRARSGAGADWNHGPLGHRLRRAHRVLLAVAAPWAGALFTSDAEVRAALTLALWVLAAGQPLAGYVFVLDGVLIGAGDARYLALAGVVNLAAVPAAAAGRPAVGGRRRRGPALAVGGVLAGLHGGAGPHAGPPRADGPVDGARRALSPGPDAVGPAAPPARAGAARALNWTGDSPRSTLTPPPPCPPRDLWKPVLVRAAVALGFGAVTVFWAAPSTAGMGWAGGALPAGHRRGAALEREQDRAPRRVRARQGPLRRRRRADRSRRGRRPHARRPASSVPSRPWAWALPAPRSSTWASPTAAGPCWPATGSPPASSAWAPRPSLPFFIDLGPHALLGVAGGGAIISGVLWMLAGLTLRHDARADSAKAVN